MSEIQNQINRLNTIVNQNSDLINQNNKLTDFLQNAMQAEFAIGKIEVVNAINEAGGNATIEDSLATLAEKILALPVISPDTTFDSSMPTPINGAYIAATGGQGIVKAYDEDVTIISEKSFAKNTSLKEINLPNATSNGSYAFENCTSLIVVNCPSLKVSGNGAFIGCKSLKKCYLKTSQGYTMFTGCDNLIDIKTSLDGNSGNIGYNPKQAYSKTSASLCYESDLEEYGQIFNTNWDKWKWCIINHFAANLQDRTGLTAFTITFGSTVLGQMDDEMKLAFTSKNWTLA